MKQSKTLSIILATTLSVMLSATAHAQADSKSADAKGGEVKVAQAASAADMTDGDIRKVDKENKKITIKHGDIKNLDMPGMTMVFQVQDPVMLERVKAGDKVKFVVEKAAGAIVITDIQVSK